jgi:putative SOS response-associated peptidase YedK
MCGRFILVSPGRIVAEHFQLPSAPALEPRYNIAPSQDVATIRQGEESETRELHMLRWGLIPFWAKESSIGYRMINAKSETVAEKPAFRNAFKRRRCLIPADGFYEWGGKKGERTPYLFRMIDESLFAFAGLWESWTGPEETVIESCTILTTGPNDLVKPVHDRMPVILASRQYDAWLDTSREARDLLLEMLVPFPPDKMTSHPVGMHVNKAANDSPECIKPI